MKLYSQPPPSHSRPEAANFPHETYNMSADPSLFHAPENPQPPKGMYYEVPKNPPMNKLPPIFPWEEHQEKASRVFPDDLPPKPTPSLSTPSVTTDSNDEDSSTSGPATPTNSSGPAGFSRTNAWDDMPEIDRYISNLPQNRRAKVQVLLNNVVQTPPGSRTPTGADNNNDPSSSSSDHPSHNQQGDNDTRRRQSTKLTDFPTELERPSLPVTPAPIRRPSFWGAERDAAGDLPPAEGVPAQSEWNPAERLVELARRQSKVLEDGPGGVGGVGGGGRTIPNREMLPSSSSPSASKPVPIAEEREDKETPATVPAPSTTSTTSTTQSPAPGVQAAPVFGALNFAGGGGGGSGSSGNATAAASTAGGEGEVAPDEGN